MNWDGSKMVVFAKDVNSLNVRLENLNDKYDNQNTTRHVDLVGLANHLYNSAIPNATAMPMV
jgi:hypothetical protein